MEDQKTEVSWAELRQALLGTWNMNNLLYHLKKKEEQKDSRHINSDDLALLNLIMQENAYKEAKRVAELSADNQVKFSAEALELSRASNRFTEATEKSTHALKNATIWLAIMTGVLAFSAIADILLRMLCRK